MKIEDEEKRRKYVKKKAKYDVNVEWGKATKY